MLAGVLALASGEETLQVDIYWFLLGSLLVVGEQWSTWTMSQISFYPLMSGPMNKRPEHLEPLPSWLG